MPNDATLPSYRRPEVEAVTPDLTLVHDLLGGTRQMHAKSADYIQKWPDEEPSVWKIRRTIETVFEGLARILSAGTGMLFAKAPQLEWNASEAVMKPQLDNVDGAGTKASVFVKRFAEASLRDGVGLLLVDGPVRPVNPDGSELTVHGGNERQLGLRPTWAAYSRAQILSWRTQVINNQRVLSQVVLYEPAEVEDGVFGVRCVHRYRVLTLLNGRATWRLWQAKKEDATLVADFEVIASGYFRNKRGEVAPFLPVAIAYTGRTDAPLTATIPMMGVAWANLSHWQQSSELRFYRALCAFPQPTVTGTLAMQPGLDAAGVMGLIPGKLRIGPMVAVHLSEADAKFAWTELTGTSMEQLENGIDEKLGQMSKLGMAFLATDTRAAETAEAKRLDATSENSTLATAAQGIEDAVNLALEYHAWYEGIEKAGAPTFEISRDYEGTAMEPAAMAVYVGAVRDAGLPPRLLLEAWLAGGRLPEGTDIDALLAEMEARIAAEDERQRQAMKDEAALKQQEPRAA